MINSQSLPACNVAANIKSQEYCLTNAECTSHGGNYASVADCRATTVIPYYKTTVHKTPISLRPLFNYGQTVSTLAWQVVAGINGASCETNPTSRRPC